MTEATVGVDVDSYIGAAVGAVPPKGVHAKSEAREKIKKNEYLIFIDALPSCWIFPQALSSIR